MLGRQNFQKAQSDRNQTEIHRQCQTEKFGYMEIASFYFISQNLSTGKKNKTDLHSSIWIGAHVYGLDSLIVKCKYRNDLDSDWFCRY